MNEMNDIDINDRDTIKDGQGKKANQNINKAVAFSILCIICGYLIYSTLSAEEKQPVESSKEKVIKQTELFQPPKPVPEKIELKEMNLKSGLPTPNADRKTFDPSLLEAAQRAPVLAYSATHNTQENSKKDPVSLDATGNEVDDASQKFNHLLKPTTLDGISASTLGNRNYVIAMGTSIPCILETAINSDQPGFVSCIISRDILSDNGRVVLLDRGTQIVGEYRSGLKRGQDRLFVLWNRAKTPNGVIIALASPATDSLGRAGVDGDVDTHWLERVGSALLVSIIRDATAYATKRLAKKEDKDEEGNTVTNSQAVASTPYLAGMLLDGFANIAPTLTKDPGELVNVFVARDLDFSSVYKLKVIDDKKQIVRRAISRDFYKNSVANPR
ncbi:type IV secretion system protein VirB10 [Bartonella ancashensis]|uniref:Inner membrane protein forms channel for type IV secretion of T-DNA complex (VirB10) n=1 Tax=Bartonella ancashensis TaxID=1318743 RepID=A0A0M4LRU5_9HYPH|nr:type IV secretion system protein VirB10 [Bartonella ancashensis]ALE03009.1 Inner membrane protein forms channel for type IV secretion of T-DNA complex (VirB10) [Bartonella ancashensis]